MKETKAVLIIALILFLIGSILLLVHIFYPETWIFSLSLFTISRLSKPIKEAVTLLFLLPTGSLIICIFRNIIGIKTYGIITPALLALSFTFKNLLIGIICFIVIVMIGIGARILLAKLKLMLGPRIGIILTIIICSLIFSIIIFEKQNAIENSSVIIFPAVILTMIIEKFIINLEESGLRTSFFLLGNTLLVAFCCLGIFQMLHFHLITYPEIIFFIVSALLMIGRYSGYRLNELFRFKDVAE